MEVLEVACGVLSHVLTIPSGRANSAGGKAAHTGEASKDYLAQSDGAVAALTTVLEGLIAKLEVLAEDAQALRRRVRVSSWH